MNPTVRFLPWVDRPGRFEPSHPYAAAVWLPVLGPTSYLAWQLLAREITRRPGGWTAHPEEICARLGVGRPGGHQSALARTLRRLERFELVHPVTDGLVLVRTTLPPVAGRHLERLPPAARAVHDHFVGAGTRRAS